MKWRFFIGACVLASLLLLVLGVPVPPIAAGIALAALVNWMKLRKASH